MTTGKFKGLGIQIEKTARIELVNPATGTPLRDKDGNPAWIDTYSTDSLKARAFGRKITDRQLNLRAGQKITGAELEANRFDMAAELSTGWNLLDLDGNPVDCPFSVQAARELYSSPETMWLFEQVSEGAGKRANFIQPLASPSQDTP